VNLGAKVKVNSRLGMALLLAKEVGSGVFSRVTLPLWISGAKSLIYNKVAGRVTWVSVTLRDP
jgi:hypothetical protein